MCIVIGWPLRTICRWKVRRDNDSRLFSIHANDIFSHTDWYHEKTSEWTLDYPPFFAYFEYVLSKFAFLVGDPHLLDIRADPYASAETVWYQRFTVILSDVVLLLAIMYVHILFNPFLLE